MSTLVRGKMEFLDIEQAPRPPYSRSESPAVNVQTSSEMDVCSQSSRIGTIAGGRNRTSQWSSVSCESVRRTFIRKRSDENELADSWSSSKGGRRAVGILVFTIAHCTVALGLGLSIGCRACYGAHGSDVDFPSQFTVSDTLREPPTRWIGLGLFVISAVLAALLFWLRHQQIQDLCDLAFPGLLRANCLSLPFGVSSCVLFIAVVTIPPSFDLSALFILRMGALSLGIVCLAMYLIIQCGWIERHMVKTEVIAASSHKLRKVLLILGGTMAFIAFPLVVIRKEISSATGEHSSSALVVGVLLLFLEFGSASLVMAAVCLTDFGSMGVNLSKLQKLQKTTYMASLSCKLVRASSI